MENSLHYGFNLPSSESEDDVVDVDQLSYNFRIIDTELAKSASKESLEDVKKGLSTIKNAVSNINGSVHDLTETKQDKLIAGIGITIENDVISATGGGGSGGVVDQTYTPESENAQSGFAVAEAVEGMATVEKSDLYTGRFSILNGNEINGLYELTLVTTVDNYIALQFEPIEQRNTNVNLAFKILTVDISLIDEYRKYIGFKCSLKFNYTGNPEVVSIVVHKDVKDKQDKLIAGENITIEGNVISAKGGGGSGGGVVDQTYNPESANAQSGKAVAEATKEIPGILTNLSTKQSKFVSDLFPGLDGLDLLNQSMSFPENWTLGVGWSGSNSSGFTHASGTDSSISFTIPNSGTNYYLVSFKTNPKLEMDVVTVSIGGSQTYDLYHGTTGASDVYYCGVQSESNGDLVISAVANWSGTISNITVKQIVTPLVAEHTITDIDGNILDEYRYNCRDLQNIWHGYQTGQMNVEGYGNVGIGCETLDKNTSGYWNVAIGRKAMDSNTVGSRNISIGQQSLSKHKSGLRNVAIGSFAMSQLTEGYQNIAIGVDAMIEAKKGWQNIGIGLNAMKYLNGGKFNIAIGENTLRGLQNGEHNLALGAHSQEGNVSGSKNIGIGFQTLKNVGSGTQNIGLGYNALAGGTGGTFKVNIGIGENAGYRLTSGSYNTMIGYAAGQNITTGVNNIVIGYQSGQNITTKSSNILIGHQVDVPDGNTYQYLNIGNLITGSMNSNIDKHVKINGGLDLSDIPTTKPSKPGRVYKSSDGYLMIS